MTYARGRRDMLRQVIKWVDAAERDQRRVICETSEDRMRFTGGMLALRGLGSALRARLKAEASRSVSVYEKSPTEEIRVLQKR